MLIAHTSTPAGQAALEQARTVKQQAIPAERLLEYESALPAAECAGTSGQIAPCSGDACPPVIPVPLKNIGEDVQHNSVRATLHIQADFGCFSLFIALFL